MEPLSFFVGLGAGLLIAAVLVWWKHRKANAASSSAIFSPEAQQMVECMNDCSSAGDFGSPEFNSCVNRCLIRKRGGAPAHPS